MSWQQPKLPLLAGTGILIFEVLELRLQNTYHSLFWALGLACFTHGVRLALYGPNQRTHPIESAFSYAGIAVATLATMLVAALW